MINRRSISPTPPSAHSEIEQKDQRQAKPSQRQASYQAIQLSVHHFSRVPFRQREHQPFVELRSGGANRLHVGLGGSCSI
jgi:hypothetical protein